MKPRYIAYIIWIIIAVLAMVCLIVPEGGFSIGKWTLRWPTLTEALDLEGDSIVDFEIESINDSLLTKIDTTNLLPIDSIVEQDTSIVHDTTLKKPQPTIPSVDVVNIDTRTYLGAFYAALDSASSMPVRVVHYGDSQIEEDRITNILRECWQKAYGGGGPGLLPLHQTIPTRTIRQWLSIDGVVQTTQEGPKRYLIYGPRSMRMTDSDEYGVMGQVAIMDSTLMANSTNIVMHIEPMNKKYKSHNYFNRIRLVAENILGEVSTNDTLIPLSDDGVTHLADSTVRCDIRLQGLGNVYGVSLETPTGVIVDNIPMRGCSGNIFTKIDSTQLSDFYHKTNTRLIILEFGGNMIPQTENPSTISGYVRNTLRQQVRYIRACAPQASILFIGPSDMSTRIDGNMTTYPLIPYMDKQLKKMATEEQIAYWSMYDAMGGKNSMVHWVEIGLAGSDYVHFTRAGANKVGRILYEWIMEYPQSLNTKP